MFRYFFFRNKSILVTSEHHFKKNTMFCIIKKQQRRPRLSTLFDLGFPESLKHPLPLAETLQPVRTVLGDTALSLFDGLDALGV